VANPGTREAEAGGSQVQGQPELHRTLERQRKERKEGKGGEEKRGEERKSEETGHTHDMRRTTV
jgi:hypothetical protein